MNVPLEGTLFVVAAPSGAGKSTLVNALLERERAISLSVSHTTRPPRTGADGSAEVAGGPHRRAAGFGGVISLSRWRCCGG